MELTIHLHPSVKVNNAWSCTSTPPYVFMGWYLVKHGNNFTLFYLLLDVLPLLFRQLLVLT